MSFDKEWEERLEKMNVIWQKVRTRNDERRSNSKAQTDTRARGRAADKYNDIWST